MSDGSACKLRNIAKELEHRMCSSNNEAQVNDEYQAEYRCLLRELGAQFAIGDSPWEQVVHSMSVIDHEMNGNGRVNWEESAYTEFLDALRKRFTPDQLAKIRWSLDEILACGRELEEQGESFRSATEAVDYLLLRVVDWWKMPLMMRCRESGRRGGRLKTLR